MVFNQNDYESQSASTLDFLKKAGVKIESTRPIQNSDCLGSVVDYKYEYGIYFQVNGSTPGNPIDGCLFFFEALDDLNSARKAIISANRNVGEPIRGLNSTGRFDTGAEIQTAYLFYQNSVKAALDQPATTTAQIVDPMIEDYPEWMVQVLKKPDAKGWLNLKPESYWFYVGENNEAIVCSFHLAANNKVAIQNAVRPEHAEMESKKNAEMESKKNHPLIVEASLFIDEHEKYTGNYIQTTTVIESINGVESGIRAPYFYLMPPDKPSQSGYYIHCKTNNDDASSVKSGQTITVKGFAEEGTGRILSNCSIVK